MFPCEFAKQLDNELTLIEIAVIFFGKDYIPSPDELIERAKELKVYYDQMHERRGE